MSFFRIMDLCPTNVYCPKLFKNISHLMLNDTVPTKSTILTLWRLTTYICRTAPLTSKRCILYIYSTIIGTEHFKHALYSASFSLQNAVCFIMLIALVPVLFTFYTQGVLKLKKKNSGAKGLIWWIWRVKCHSTLNGKCSWKVWDNIHL